MKFYVLALALLVFPLIVLGALGVWTIEPSLNGSLATEEEKIIALKKDELRDIESSIVLSGKYESALKTRDAARSRREAIEGRVERVKSELAEVEEQLLVIPPQMEEHRERYFEIYYRRGKEAREELIGQKLESLKLASSGKTFSNVEVKAITRENIRLAHKNGFYTLAKDDIPAEWRDALIFPPKKSVAKKEPTAAKRSPKRSHAEKAASAEARKIAAELAEAEKRVNDIDKKMLALNRSIQALEVRAAQHERKHQAGKIQSADARKIRDQISRARLVLSGLRTERGTATRFVDSTERRLNSAR